MPKIKNLIFMGSSSFALPCLEELANSEYRPILCITQTDKAQGRNKQIKPSPLKLKMQELALNIFQPEDINSLESLAYLNSFSPDIIIVVAYGAYLKKEIRQLPFWGCFNLHPSLLPKYRGASPIYSALKNGDKITGNSIFKIVAKMDAGPLYFQEKIKILPEDNNSTLSEKLAKLGAISLLKVLQKLEKEEISPHSQNDALAIFTNKILKEDTFIVWDKKAKDIYNTIKSLSYSPSAVAKIKAKRIKILKAKVLKEKSFKKAGTIVDIIKDKGIVVPAKITIYSCKKFNLKTKNY